MDKEGNQIGWIKGSTVSGDLSNYATKTDLNEKVSKEEGKSLVDNELIEKLKELEDEPTLRTIGVEEEVFDENGNYIPTVWGIGDKITAERLNKIEEGIDGAYAIDTRESKYYGNLITPEVLSNTTKESYIRGQSDGIVKTNSSTQVTDYIPLLPNTEYSYEMVYSGYAAFYDENYNYISGYGLASNDPMPNPVVTPEGTAYGRFTLNNDIVNNYGDSDRILLCMTLYNNEISEQYVVVEEPSLLNIDNRFICSPLDFQHDYFASIFNKILCIGDSLTQGTFNVSVNGNTIRPQYAWPTYFTKLTNVETTNAGEAGCSTLTYYESHKDDDWSGHDCAIIQLGVNDVIKKDEHGITDEITVENLQLIIDKIRAENKNCPIFVSGIVKNRWYGDSKYLSMNELIKQFACNREDEHIYYIDHQSDSWTFLPPYSLGHFGSIGYLRLAYEYKKHISYIVYKHRSNFKNQHLVGTDYEPYEY